MDIINSKKLHVIITSGSKKSIKKVSGKLQQIINFICYRVTILWLQKVQSHFANLSIASSFCQKLFPEHLLHVDSTLCTIEINNVAQTVTFVKRNVLGCNTWRSVTFGTLIWVCNSLPSSPRTVLFSLHKAIFTSVCNVQNKNKK